MFVDALLPGGVPSVVDAQFATWARGFSRRLSNFQNFV